MDTKQVILELRTQKGMSQDELAEKVFVSRQAVSRWENGETVPNTETLKLLSKVFDVSINTLLGSPRKLICQCCGMPLEDDDIIGHNHDGSFSEDYCKWCYADGTYTYNDMDDLIEVCVKNMVSENFTEEQARSYMKELLPTLDYWKKYDELSDNGQFEEFKKKLINEINELNVDGMPKVEKLNTQLFNLLCERADDVYNGRLPYHVRLLLDEFSNIGHIPKWDKLIATIRSREISASIILQSKSQLKTMYKDAAETIIGNCDSTLFLGGKEESTLKEISEILGKETIDLYNTSDTRGNSRSYGLNYQKTGKELMSKDELSVMDGDKCILQIRGVRPFLSNKFDITKHKRYKELADYDAGNLFDIEAYLKHELRLYMNEMFDFMECSVTPEEIEKLKTEQVPL